MPSINDLVKSHYPNAISYAAFKEKLRTLVREHEIDQSKMLLAASICADDIIAMRDTETPDHKARLKKDFLGPFSLGGLGGIPYSGLTGMSAVAHHIPDGGSLLVAYGPHIGMTDQGKLGELLRPGQCRETSACGALAHALQNLRSSPDYVPPYNDDDTEQMTLERRLLPYREQILASDAPLKAATEITYGIIHDLIYRYVRARKAEFGCESIVLAGGILINTSHQHEDYIDLRHIAVIPVAEL